MAEPQKNSGGLSAQFDPEEGIEEAEEWEAWESKLVNISLAIGIGALIIGGTIVNLTLL